MQTLSAGLLPIVCVGETEEELYSGQSKAALTKQLTETLADLTPEQLHGLHLLYDAAWINRSPWEASNKQLQNAYKTFKEALAESFKKEIAANFNLLYAVPTFSPDLLPIIASLPAAGYSLGKLNANSQINLAPPPNSRAAAAPARTIESKAVASPNQGKATKEAAPSLGSGQEPLKKKTAAAIGKQSEQVKQKKPTGKNNKEVSTSKKEPKKAPAPRVAKAAPKKTKKK